MKKRLRCRLGFHQGFRDHVGKNLGSDKVPFFVFETYWQCNYCPSRERVYD